MRCVRTQAEEERGTNIKSKPRICGTEENFEVLSLTEVVIEIGPASFGGVDTLDEILVVSGSANQDVVDVARGLVNVALNIHGKTGCLWDGQTEVKSNNPRNGPQTDEDAPHVIDGVEVCYVRLSE